MMALSTELKNERPRIDIVNLEVGCSENNTALAAVVNRITANAIMVNTTAIGQATQPSQPTYKIESIHYSLSHLEKSIVQMFGQEYPDQEIAAKFLKGNELAVLDYATMQKCLLLAGGYRIGNFSTSNYATPICLGDNISYPTATGAEKISISSVSLGRAKKILNDVTGTICSNCPWRVSGSCNPSPTINRHNFNNTVGIPALKVNAGFILT